MDINKKRLYTFLGIVFTLSWGLVAIIPLSGDKYGSNKSMLILTLLMMMPALSSILTRLITKEGFKDMYLKPKFKKNIKYYLGAYFIPSIFIILGGILFFIIFPGKLDTNLIATKEMLKSHNIKMDANTFILINLVQGMLIGPIINIIPTLGEELGWRGYLIQKLSKHFSIQKTIIISGIIWGVWHAPVIAMGHNYGTGYMGAPWGGILAMIGFCIVVGSYLSYLAVKTQSVIPCAIVHSGINAFAAFPVFLCKGTANPFIGPGMMGIIGGSLFIVLAIYCYISLGKVEQPFEA